MATASFDNSWVDSYLEALLSFGLSTEYNQKAAQEAGTHKNNADRQIYRKYYVNQVLQLSEEGIRDAWSKATSVKNAGEKDARLEYLSWRVWAMKQKKARVVSEEVKRMANEVALVEIPDETVLDDDNITSDDDDKSHKPSKPSTELVKAKAKAEPTPPAPAPDKLEGLLSKSLKVTVPPASEAAAAEAPVSYADFLSPRTDEHVPHADPFENRVDGLYVILISLHGLVRGDQMELGKDPDTGGQVKYVVELARALALHPAVLRVDLLTRLIADPKVDSSYSVEEECLVKGEHSDMAGAYICRLPCGPSEQYLRKEKLWPHVREFADRGIAHAKKTLAALAEARCPCELYAVHGHYADAGEVAALMASTLNVDMVMTGHSLGRNKLEHLLASGQMSKSEIEASYKISRRIEAEERALDSAVMVFTSTQQEVDEQWGLYDGYDRKLEDVLRARRRLGRHMPYMNVIPPGLDFSNLKVDLPEDPALMEMKKSKSTLAFVSTPRNPESDPDEAPPGPSSTTTPLGSPHRQDGNPTPFSGLLRRPVVQPDPPIWTEIARFLKNPRKPVVLAMSRPDTKKNITTLVKAFGENQTLREIANLVLIMGNRENIDSMAAGSAKVLNQVLKLIDSHDLYGSVAYPKRHTQKDISDIYRLPFATRGLFTNVALQEPFGLTVIEAAAHGVPTVATKNGGPVDILTTLHHGLLVDPTDSEAIAQACLKILCNPDTWDEMSQSGIANIMAYSWPSHCKRYLEAVEMEKRAQKTQKRHRMRMSGSWDQKTFKDSLGDATINGIVSGLRSGAATPPTSVSPSPAMLQPGAFMDRLMSTPEPSSVPIFKTISGISNDDLSIPDSAPAEDGTAEGHPRGFSRKQFVVVSLDGEFCVPAVAEMLKAVIAARNAAGAKHVGIGVLSCVGFDDNRRLLQEAGVNVGELDFMVNNSGADIWHAKDGTEDEWDADEHWEQHIDFRWDRLTLGRFITKLVTAPPGSMSIMPSMKAGSALMRALSALPSDRQTGIHPNHIVLPLDPESKSVLAKSSQRNQAGVVSTAVVDRLRRRLRSNGYRTHLTLSMVPEDQAADELTSVIHVTPMRASRALSLRFLAVKFGVDMSLFTVVIVPPFAKQSSGGNSQIASFSSDLAELVSGLNRVFVQVPGANNPQAIDPSRLDQGDAVSLEKLKVLVGPKVFGERVALVEGEPGKQVAALMDGKHSASHEE